MSKGDILLSYITFSQHQINQYNSELLLKESFNPNFLKTYIFGFLVLGHKHKDISAIVNESIDGLNEIIRMHENMRVYHNTESLSSKISFDSDDSTH